MKSAQLLREIVLPRLLVHEGFKEALADAVREIPITDLASIVSELPIRKTLTIGTLPEASNNVLANMIVEMRVQLLDAVEAHANPSEKPKWTPSRGGQGNNDTQTETGTRHS